MATLYVVNGSKMPSKMYCDLKIMGTNKPAVVDAAYQHAISPIHNHSLSEPGSLKKAIEQTLEIEEV